MSEPDPNLIETLQWMPNEFNFCINCLNTALNDPTVDNRIWNSRFSVPPNQELFTENVRKALLRLMAVDVSCFACTTFSSWFVDDKVTRPLTKTLLDAMTASFLMRSFEASDFLRHCALMSELAAQCFTAGVVEAPDYAVGCLLYCIREFGRLKTMNWNSVFTQAEAMIRSWDDPNAHFQRLGHVRTALMDGVILIQ